MITPGPYVKLEDVAKHAGVSLATASRVLHGGPSHRGRPDLRERVLTSAKTLGYVANPHARALASATSDTVGLIVQDVRDPYFAVVAGGAIGIANEHGLMVTIVCTYRDPKQEAKYVSMLRAQRVRAIIFAGSAYEAPSPTRAMAAELEAYCSSGGAVVSITRHRFPGDTVFVKNHESSADLARALLDLGHREFAVIAGPKKLTTSLDRVAGFKSALSEAGIRIGPDQIVHDDFDRDGGHAAATRILEWRSRPSCVFAVNDAMALGTLAAFRANGVRVPDDIAVAGFGDIPASADSVPALTTVHLPLDALGAEAMRLALRSDHSAGARTLSIGGQVMLRDSTARLVANGRAAPRKRARRAAAGSEVT